MGSRDYRLRAAQQRAELEQKFARRRQETAAQGKRPAGAWTARTLGRARVWTRLKLERAGHAAADWLDRVRTPKPAAAAIDPRTLVIGHRGSPMRRVENTLPSFECAIAEGANAVEVDLCYTKDREVVVWHDWEPNDPVALVRQFGLEPNVKYGTAVPRVLSEYRRPTHELTLAELRTHYGYQRRWLFFFTKRARVTIPTFREFLQWAAAKAELRAVFLDLKIPDSQLALVPEFVAAIGQLVGEFRPRFESILMTPREPVCAKIRQCAAEWPVSYDVEVPPGIVTDAAACSGVKAAIRHQNRYASVGRPALTLGAWSLYQRIIDHDLALQKTHNHAHPNSGVEQLIAWTIDHPDELRRLLQLGVHGILTNRPRRLRRLARRLSAGE